MGTPLTPFDLVVLALATCYWAWVVPKKAGPYQVFEKLRAKTTLGGLLLCPPCLSIWVAAILWLISLTSILPFVWISAIAGAATLLGYYTGTWMQ